MGAVCAVLGSVVSVAAGVNFGNVTNEYGTAHVLRTIAAQPSWYWPAVHLAFIVGAFLWVGAFVVLATTFTRGASWVTGRLAVAAVVIGAAVHVVDSSISGFGLSALAHDWASTSEPSGLLRVGDTLLYLLNGTWRSVHSYFHGLPFLLAGAATVLSRRYPAWLGYVGLVGGAASLLGGVLQFLGVVPGTERLVIVPAQLVSLWMVAMGVLLWRAGRNAQLRAGSPAGGG